MGGLPLICHHQKERTKPHAPRAPSPAGCPGRASVRRGRPGPGHSSPCRRRPSQELKKPCPERGQQDSVPPDPQMLHEHILRGTRAPRWWPGHPSPSPFPGLWLRAKSRRLLSSLTQKCFISLPAPLVGKASHVQLRFFAVVWVGLGGGANVVPAQSLPALVSRLGSGVHSPAPPRSDRPPHFV